jgi:hypothetical protein
LTADEASANDAAELSIELFRLDSYRGLSLTQVSKWPLNCTLSDMTRTSLANHELNKFEPTRGAYRGVRNAELANATELRLSRAPIS